MDTRGRDQTRCVLNLVSGLFSSRWQVDLVCASIIPALALDEHAGGQTAGDLEHHYSLLVPVIGSHEGRFKG